MALKVQVQDNRPNVKTVIVEGRLDNDSVEAFDKELDGALASGVTLLVFDLAHLEYVTSAGLRSIFRAQKALLARGGKSLLLSPTPQVQKVLEIVKVPELQSVFRSVKELDEYLDAMQKKVTDGDE
jgi:anti-anti-sigma factor